ncbi:MAG: CRISPR-associated protein Cas4, partial [Candidatus Lokiarchaeia archaeon]
LKFSIDNSNLEIGKYIHETHWLHKYKHKKIYLISHNWKLKGICDYKIEEHGIKIPVELKKGKSNKNKPFKNDKMQLMCYILLLEEHFDVKYPYGYIFYLGSKRRYKVNITLNLRSRIQKCFKEIKSYMNSNKIPKRQNNEKSYRNCSYHEHCRSV